jgi:predicted aldo/keto reductase-like oxidoreductase
MLPRKFRRRMNAGRLSPVTNTTTFFHLITFSKYADLIRKRLGTDSIDLLQFHVWTEEWSDAPNFRRTVEKLKGDGTIRYFGLSLNGWEPKNGSRPFAVD